jgi:hypothetical protein
MEVYLGKNRTWVTTNKTTHATVKHLTIKVGHKYQWHIDNFFSSTDLFDDLTKQKINYCRPVTQEKGNAMWYVTTKWSTETR